VATDGADYDRDTKRCSPVVKLDDQCELASEVHASLIIGKHADESGFNRTIALLMQPETDEKEHRYDDNYRLSARQSYVIVHSTWFDDAVQRECHLTNYESANQDSRQRPLSVSQQAINDQPTVLTSGDNYRRLLYPCRQCIWSQYSLAFDSAMFIAYSSSAFRRKDWLQQLCSSPSVRSTPFHSFEVVDASSVASMSLTTESSVGTRASREVASPPMNMRSSREMASPTRDFVTIAECSETAESSINVRSSSEMTSLPGNAVMVPPPAMSPALVSTRITDVEKELYHGISQQAECDENVHTEHHIVTSEETATYVTNIQYDIK